MATRQNVELSPPPAFDMSAVRCSLPELRYQEQPVGQQSLDSSASDKAMERGGPHLKHSLCETVIKRIVDNVKADGHTEDTVQRLTAYFASLPSRCVLSERSPAVIHQ